MVEEFEDTTLAAANAKRAQDEVRGIRA